MQTHSSLAIFYVMPETDTDKATNSSKPHRLCLVNISLHMISCSRDRAHVWTSSSAVRQPVSKPDSLPHQGRKTCSLCYVTRWWLARVWKRLGRVGGDASAELSAAQSLLVLTTCLPPCRPWAQVRAPEANVEAGGQVRVHGAGLAGGETQAGAPPAASPLGAPTWAASSHSGLLKKDRTMWRTPRLAHSSKQCLSRIPWRRSPNTHSRSIFCCKAPQTREHRQTRESSVSSLKTLPAPLFSRGGEDCSMAAWQPPTLRFWVCY